MLMLYIIEFIDGIAPNIYYKCNSKWDEVEKDLIDAVELDLKERKLSEKDMVKEQERIEEAKDKSAYDLGNVESDVDEISDFVNGANEDKCDEEKLKNSNDEINDMYKTVFVNQDQDISDDWSSLKFI